MRSAEKQIDELFVTQVRVQINAGPPLTRLFDPVLDLLCFQAQISFTVVVVVLAFGFLGIFSGLTSASAVCKCSNSGDETPKEQKVRMRAPRSYI